MLLYVLKIAIVSVYRICTRTCQKLPFRVVYYSRLSLNVSYEGEVVNIIVIMQKTFFFNSGT